MLVLTRHLLEKIRIGEDITITVVEIRGACVRIGIDAPKELSVHRQEIFDRIGGRTLAGELKPKETNDANL